MRLSVMRTNNLRKRTNNLRIFVSSDQSLAPTNFAGVRRVCVFSSWYVTRFLTCIPALMNLSPGMFSCRTASAGGISAELPHTTTFLWCTVTPCHPARGKKKATKDYIQRQLDSCSPTIPLGQCQLYWKKRRRRGNAKPLIIFWQPGIEPGPSHPVCVVLAYHYVLQAGQHAESALEAY